MYGMARPAGGLKLRHHSHRHQPARTPSHNQQRCRRRRGHASARQTRPNSQREIRSSSTQTTTEEYDPTLLARSQICRWLHECVRMCWCVRACACVCMHVHCAGACINVPAYMQSACACACMHACSSAEACVRAWSAHTCQGACVSVRARSIASCAVYVHSCADARARMCSVCVHG